MRLREAMKDLDSNRWSQVTRAGDFIGDKLLSTDPPTPPFSPVILLSHKFFIITCTQWVQGVMIQNFIKNGFSAFSEYVLQFV